jgi:hypothetical protein
MSVLQQDFEGAMELSVFNDASKVFTGLLLGDSILYRTHLREVPWPAVSYLQDKSRAIIEKWKVKLEDSGISVVIGGHDSPSPRGGNILNCNYGFLATYKLKWFRIATIWRKVSWWKIASW